MHTQALSDRLLPTADAGLQATFSSIFQSISWLSPPYEQHTLIHDNISLCFLSLTDLSIHKHRKTQASWVSATDSYGEKSLPALQLHFARHQNHVFANNLLWWFRLTFNKNPPIHYLNKLEYFIRSIKKNILVNCWPSGKYVHLLYMYSILGRGSFCFNYCLNSAWHGGDQFVALLRWYGSPGFFDSGLQVICIVGSGVSHLPLDNTP